MSEIRFSSPQAPEPVQYPKAEISQTVLPPKTGKGRAVKIISVIVLVIIVVFALFRYYSNIQKIFTGPEDPSYYAAFLSNGHVYFGQLQTNSQEEFVLKNVYYLQLSTEEQQEQAQLPEPKFSLVKLGNELHGPTDEIFINREHILFYEKLREDSNVVKLIKNEGQQ